MRPSSRETALPVLDEHECRHDVDLEALGELRVRVDIDAADAQALALFALEMGEQALHPAGGARAFGPEEYEQGPVDVMSLMNFLLGAANDPVSCCMSRKQPRRNYTGAAMGDWYTIGLALGLGIALGMLFAGLLSATPLGRAAAVVLAGAAGALVGTP